MGALDTYHDGDVEPIVGYLAVALELAVVIGARIASDVEGVLARWASANDDRAGSPSLRTTFITMTWLTPAEVSAANSATIAR